MKKSNQQKQEQWSSNKVVCFSIITNSCKWVVSIFARFLLVYLLLIFEVICKILDSVVIILIDNGSWIRLKRFKINFVKKKKTIWSSVFGFFLLKTFGGINLYDSLYEIFGPLSVKLLIRNKKTPVIREFVNSIHNSQRFSGPFGNTSYIILSYSNFYSWYLSFFLIFTVDTEIWSSIFELWRWCFIGRCHRWWWVVYSIYQFHFKLDLWR